MKNALLLHGTNGDSKVSWLPWLKGELEDLGWKVWVPDLPQSAHPNIQRYNDFLFSNKDWQYDTNSLIVGHSSGSVAALGLLQDLPEGARIGMCILIGSFRDNLGWDNLDGLFERPLISRKLNAPAINLFLFTLMMTLTVLWSTRSTYRLSWEAS